MNVTLPFFAQNLDPVILGTGVGVSDRAGGEVSDRAGGEVSDHAGGEVSDRAGGEVSDRAGAELSIMPLLLAFDYFCQAVRISTLKL